MIIITVHGYFDSLKLQTRNKQFHLAVNPGGTGCVHILINALLDTLSPATDELSRVEP